MPTYEDRVSLPSLKELREVWNIDTDKIKSKEERLILLNKKRKIDFNKELVEKQKKYMEEFNSKYLYDEEMWEFQALSIFLHDNPFKDIYDYVKPYGDVENDLEVVIVGVISDVTKKKDRNKKQFAYVNLYSAFGLVEVVC